MVEMNPFAGQCRDTDLGNRHVDPAGEGGWEKQR